MNLRRLSLVLTALLATGAHARADDFVTIDAGPHDRRETPVVVPLPESLAGRNAFVLKADDGAAPIAAQRLPGETRAVAVVPELPAKASRRYRIEPADAESSKPHVVCEDDGKALTLKVDGRPVLTYHTAVVESPDGLDPVFRRSGHIHPLRTPLGRVVTDDFAPDHAHQHGVFFAWVNTTFDGRRVDFWNQAGKTGRVRHMEVIDRTSGPVFAQFRVRLRHESLAGDNGPTPALDETWLVRTYRTTTPFLVDLESRQTPAGDRLLVLNEYHYGGFGLRAQRAWFDDQVKGEAPPDPKRSGESDFLTSDGKRRADGNHTRPRWVDVSGKVDGAFAGLVILDHPGNFRFPQPVRLHPNKPYLSIAPSVLGAFTIEPGQTYVSRYRLDVHDGPPDPKAIDRQWTDYAEPPTAK